MKRFLDGKMRMLSLLLSLVLVVGLLPLVAVSASAAGNSFSYAYDCQRSEWWPTQGSTFEAYNIKKPYNGSTQPTEPSGTWVLTSKGYWTSRMSSTLGANTYFDPVISLVAGAYGIQPSQVEVYELTKDDTHIAYGAIFTRSSNAGEAATFLGDNWDQYGCTYLLSDTALTIGGSVDVTVGQDLTTNAPAAHTHTWPAVTPTGNGSKEAYATIKCATCDETLKVTLTASDVTLPGDVFTAQISTGTPGISNYALRATPTLPEGLGMSATPGYKYSVSGSDFTAIDPNNFTPKQGIYQASIRVWDANNNVVTELAVKYTVSDPVVTAATGDNRPIEMMVMGLLVFSAMAAVAFIFDSKRRVGR